MFSKIQQARYELHQQEFAAVSFDRFCASLEEGRGIENIPTCPECRRATVLIEVEYNPQMSLRLREDEPEREKTGLYCEWCGAKIDPRSVSEKAPRKPATGEWESFDEQARRRA